MAKHIMDRRDFDACELVTLGGVVRARREGEGVAIELAKPRIVCPAVS